MKKILILGVALIVLTAGVFIYTKNSNSIQPITQNNNKEVLQESSENVSKTCSGKPLVELTEGPYYKAGSPERRDITEEGTPGIHLILKGYVMDADCKPVANAWLDFWQADGEGNYDNNGFNLRGHQYTDENGLYTLKTVVPTRYTGRTEHIHFKVRKTENSSAITSQLFFPDSTTNSEDSIFDESLVVNFGTDSDGSKYATYNIIAP